MISSNHRWSWRHSLRECLLNLTSWGSRGCVELMFAVLAGATLAAWHAAQWDQLDRTLDQQAILGRNTVIFGPDGALWFTAQNSNVIGRLEIEIGKISEFGAPTLCSWSSAPIGREDYAVTCLSFQTAVSFTPTLPSAA